MYSITMTIMTILLVMINIAFFLLISKNRDKIVITEIFQKILTELLISYICSILHYYSEVDNNCDIFSG